MARKRIVFMGVGALGSTAVVLCRNVDADIRLVDFDRVDSKNLLSQAYVKQSVGLLKAEALKRQLYNFWGVRVEALPVRVTPENVAELCRDCDLIVDCFDNAASRRVLSAHLERVLMLDLRTTPPALVHAAISADGTFGLIRWDEHFKPDAEDREGQATCEGGEHLPMIGQLGAALARLVQDFVAGAGFRRRDVQVSLGTVSSTFFA